MTVDHPAPVPTTMCRMLRVLSGEGELGSFLSCLGFTVVTTTTYTIKFLCGRPSTRLTGSLPRYEVVTLYFLLVPRTSQGLTIILQNGRARKKGDLLLESKSNEVEV